MCRNFRTRRNTLLNGLYDAKADNTPVIAITGTTYSDLMNSSYQQDVNLIQLYSDVTVYNSMIDVPEQAEMAVDIACRTALAQRGVSHLTIPIDVQERKISGNALLCLLSCRFNVFQLWISVSHHICSHPYPCDQS
jgi:thiamine pyrophosphate-dependent acetolactate synthase large subunit-like protein